MKPSRDTDIIQMIFLIATASSRRLPPQRVGGLPGSSERSLEGVARLAFLSRVEPEVEGDTERRHDQRRPYPGAGIGIGGHSQTVRDEPGQRLGQVGLEHGAFV